MASATLHAKRNYLALNISTRSRVRAGSRSSAVVPDKDLPKCGDVVAGKYVLDEILGMGGMGAVYRATHRVTGKSFAIKWLLPRLSQESDAVKRFIREAQVAGRVDHPNIVEVYDVGQDGPSFYMVMELLKGESLAHRITGRQKMSALEICQILVPITRGLAAAHKAGVIHRDLKPDNIFLCRTPEGGEELPKVLDFGISKMSLPDNEVGAGLTRQGAIMGTPHYMSPEQVRGIPIDARTDVYALGVILYQALSGQLPFDGDNYGDLIVKILNEAPKPLSTLAPETPPRLIELVERAMARDAERRHASALDFGVALEPFAGGTRFDTARPIVSTPPRVATLGPETPLSTESMVQPLPSAHASGARAKPTRKLIVLTAAVAAAVIGLTVLVGKSLDSARSEGAAPAADSGKSDAPVDVHAATPAPPTAPPAAPSKAPETPPDTEEALPIPNTVPRLEPEAKPTPTEGQVDPAPAAPIVKPTPAKPPHTQGPERVRHAPPGVRARPSPGEVESPRIPDEQPNPSRRTPMLTPKDF